MMVEKQGIFDGLIAETPIMVSHVPLTNMYLADTMYALQEKGLVSHEMNHQGKSLSLETLRTQKLFHFSPRHSLLSTSC